MGVSLKQSLGFFIGLLSGTSLILNVLALIAVFRLAFIVRKNHVYIITFFNILSNVIQMALATFYLAPTIITSSFLVSTEKKSKWTLVFGSAFLFFWYFETFTQIVMALNRYLVICLQKHHIFTTTTTILIFLFLIPFSFGLMYNSQYVNPCCSFLFDQEYLSYSYYTLDGVTNYSDEFDIPLNASSSIISGLCYIKIFWTQHKSSPICPTFAAEQLKRRRKKDIRYAIQFSLTLVFYIFVWVFLRVLPVMLENRHVEWFILVPFFYTVNCSSAAIINIGLNNEVQKNLLPKSIYPLLQHFGLTRFDAPTINATLASVTIQSKPSVLPVAIRFIPTNQHQPFRSIGVIRD
ncbi:7TM GPCR serpentine receptor class x (Srx) domain-containing protein [Caenorhabditis elegans]|uniref:7TM GPCR serpentine receptor class x (Srx) domain-containing protein n=1 Tax=Caenorhabditis elegans TaxID=6239 RepID=Q21684_CAEEL|nr:7TM GPCR serpentine receptor class x (Srx) domain-containing protein [Caenorhabditis elegans]CCD65672.1 7TM GPCR serpentine receptor class x (Srx) domain-containing protein [Caenorhabditis elegans]|eukprot:NP_505329.2 Serpentine Receptor, class X [Caenorhabditis elegans]